MTKKKPQNKFAPKRGRRPTDDRRTRVSTLYEHTTHETVNHEVIATKTTMRLVGWLVPNDGERPDTEMLAGITQPEYIRAVVRFVERLARTDTDPRGATTTQLEAQRLLKKLRIKE